MSEPTISEVFAQVMRVHKRMDDAATAEELVREAIHAVSEDMRAQLAGYHRENTERIGRLEARVAKLERKDAA